MSRYSSHSVSQCVTLLLTALSLAACDQSPTALQSGSVAPRSDVASTAPTSSPVKQVAHGIALAMQAPVVRNSVLQAMRQSEWSEHKLVLPDFLRTKPGRQLDAAVSTALGARDGELKRLVRELPTKMDFYVPSPSQRQTWQGSSRILVVGLDVLDATSALAFGPDGSSQTITTPDVSGVDAVLVIHPSQFKRKHDWSQSSSGSAIQDQTVAEESATPTVSQAGTDPSGTQVATESACDPTVVIECDTGGGSGTTQGTYVGTIIAHFADGFYGASEIYFVTAYQNQPDTEVTSDTVDEVYQNVPKVINLRIFFDQPGIYSAPILASLWEADSGLNGGDDYKGQSFPPITGPGAYESLGIDLTTVWADYNIYTQSSRVAPFRKVDVSCWEGQLELTLPIMPLHRWHLRERQS